MPTAMTAHIVYTAADAKRPMTTARGGDGIIRRELVDGPLMSDDICMKASAARRAQPRGDAGGCDVLHRNGVLKEMEAVAASAPALSESGARRLDAALRRVAGRPRPDLDAARR
jgi:beta-N-acetylhexosaminidase